MDDEPDSGDSGSYGQKTLTLEKINSDSKRLTLDELRQTTYRPLEKLTKTKEEINYSNNISEMLKEYSMKILPKGTKFCPLLNYPHSNCNGKKYNDGNCFETKMPGCRDGKIYLTLKRKTNMEKFSLFTSSYLSKIIDIIIPRGD